MSQTLFLLRIVFTPSLPHDHNTYNRTDERERTLKAPPAFACVGKKDRSCGPSYSCHFCKNNQNATKETCMNETDLVGQDQPSDNTYIERATVELEEFRSEEMDDDEL